jgi:hypothetical protein
MNFDGIYLGIKHKIVKQGLFWHKMKNILFSNLEKKLSILKQITSRKVYKNLKLLSFFSI